MMEGLIEAANSALQFAAAWWWVPFPFVFGALFLRAWLIYIRTKYIAEIDWTLLQLTIPQDITKTPLAMEQVFAGMHAILSKPNTWDTYVKGKVQEWYSLEIRSVGGTLGLYIRTPSKSRNIVESHIYAQFPQAEIQEVEDYIWNYPLELPNDEYDLYGAEFVLTREDVYPIRTWQEFQFEIDPMKAESNVDPLAGLIEALTRLREGEEFWLQLGIKPVDDSWKKEGEKEIAKIAGREVKEASKGAGVLPTLGKETKDILSGLVQAPFKKPEYSSTKKEEKKEEKKNLTPGETDILKALERNISKVGFEVAMRGVYIARKELSPNMGGFFSVMSALRQFSTQNLNGFKPNGDTITSGKWPFKKHKENFRKKRLLNNYRIRGKPKKSFIFNIEELATLFHFPSRIVSAPSLPRIPVKKSEPPPELPTL